MSIKNSLGSCWVYCTITVPWVPETEISMIFVILCTTCGGVLYIMTNIQLYNRRKNTSIKTGGSFYTDENNESGKQNKGLHPKQTLCNHILCVSYHEHVQVYVHVCILKQKTLFCHLYKQKQVFTFYILQRTKRTYILVAHIFS